MDEKTEKTIQNLEIYECEILNFTEDIKALQSNPERRIITSLVASLQASTSQIRELVVELKEKP